MKIKNSSQYDTRTLGRIFKGAWNGFNRMRAVKIGYVDNPQFRKSHPEPDITIHITKGPRNQINWKWKMANRTDKDVYVKLPPLTGTEFVAIMREQHGGVAGTHASLTVDDVALIAQQIFYTINGWSRKQGRKNTLTIHTRAEVAMLEDRKFVPMRILKPKVERTRDQLQEKYDRAIELERKWTTKLKLAQTKLKKARERKKRYAKRLAERESAQEEAA